MKFPPAKDSALNAIKCAKFPCLKENEELPDFLKANILIGLYNPVERVNIEIFNSVFRHGEPIFYSSKTRVMGMTLYRRRLDTFNESSSFPSRIESKTLVWYYSFPHHKPQKKLKKKFILPFDKLKLTQSIIDQI